MKKQIDPEDIHRILVINLGGIGDILLSTPALRALKDKYPASRLSILVSPRASDVAKRFPFIDKIYTLSTGREGVASLSMIPGDVNTLIALRKERFDLAINMRTLVSNSGALKIRLLVGIIGARTTAGRNTEGRGPFFNITIDETGIGDKYEREYDIELVEKLGAKVADKTIYLPIDADDRKKAGAIFSGAGIGRDEVVIGVHPGGKPSHRWELDRFAEAMNAISKRVRCVFIVTGEAGEKNLADGLIGSVSAKVFDATGKLDIYGLAALIERCDLYISNDTGAMHLAATLGVSLVAIFGPGYLKRFDPRTISDKAEVMYKKAACSPCERWTCNTMDCLRAISPDEVAGAALKLLK